MRCPTPCDVCGELEELDRLTFNTDHCNCKDGCTHGVCLECMNELCDEPHVDEDDA
mgnify:CR=1 FL=1